MSTADGEEATVEKIEREELDEAVEVYNFNVMDYHTYYVGENGVLVHNKCNTPESPAGESGSPTSKPNQVHHYATDKSKKYTQAFEEILDKYGLDLDDGWNKDLLPHQGRHPNAYHDFVLDEMKNIDNIANGNKEIFLDLYESALKSIIRENPDMLYSNYWK